MVDECLHDGFKNRCPDKAIDKGPSALIERGFAPYLWAVYCISIPASVSSHLRLSLFLLSTLSSITPLTRPPPLLPVTRYEAHSRSLTLVLVLAGSGNNKLVAMETGFPHSLFPYRWCGQTTPMFVKGFIDCMLLWTPCCSLEADSFT